MNWGEVILSVLNMGTIAYMFLGVFVGITVGALPGLTATMTVALLTPLTFWLPPEYGFAMLIGVYNSAIFAGGTTAILLNTPGTPASIATTFDGYELTKQGKPGLALGLNTIYSVIGGFFGTFVLMIAAFPIARFALKFGPPEYFALAVFGLSMIISVSETSVIKGLIVGVLGLLLSTIGLDPMLSSQRFTFNNINLMQGINFIPIMIGLFGVGEIFNQILTKKNENKANNINLKKMGRVFPTLKELKRLFPSTSLSAIISVFIGAIPGAGGDIASIICWDQAKKMSKKPEEYGKGSIEGVANTCLANNGVIGGALTTMLTLGIPGDAVTAVLIGSMMMYGMQPGPKLFIDHQGFVMKMMLFMIMAYIFIFIIGMLGAKISTQILKIRDEAIWMTVLLLCVVGSYSLNSSYYDVIFMSIAGIFGLIFRKMEFPLGPLILGLLLGNMAESNMRRALALSQGSYAVFFTRPISIILLILAFVSLVLPIIKSYKCKNKVS